MSFCLFLLNLSCSLLSQRCVYALLGLGSETTRLGSEKHHGFSLKQLFCSSRSQVEISTAVFTIFWCLRPQKHLEHLQLSTETSSCETPAASIISVSLLHHSYSLFLSACINTLVVWKQIYIFLIIKNPAVSVLQPQMKVCFWALGFFSPVRLLFWQIAAFSSDSSWRSFKLR